jgi:hypothetical protein
MAFHYEGLTSRERGFFIILGGHGDTNRDQQQAPERKGSSNFIFMMPQTGDPTTGAATVCRP